MEKLDVLDAKGNFTGKSKLRSEVHRDGDWHRTAHVWLINDKGELLMQKRAPNKDTHAGKWDMTCGGHILAGQTSIDSAVREVEEELGIKTKPSDFKFLFSTVTQAIHHNGTFINNSFHDVYIVRKNLDISKLILQGEEVSDVKWISLAELENILKTHNPEYIRHDEEYAGIIKILK